MSKDLNTVLVLPSLPGLFYGTVLSSMRMSCSTGFLAYIFEIVCGQCSRAERAVRVVECVLVIIAGRQCTAA